MIRLSGRHSASSMRLSWRPARLPGSADRLTLYLPVSTPRARGLYGTTPSPNALAAGSSSISGWRFMRL